jgi:hypothetical protein
VLRWVAVFNERWLPGVLNAGRVACRIEVERRAHADRRGAELESSHPPAWPSRRVTVGWQSGRYAEGGTPVHTDEAAQGSYSAAP